MLGTHTSEIEVSQASNQGFWLLLDEREVFLAFTTFPWFRKATMEQLTTIERPSRNHLYWPLLDIDLSVESIFEPDRFPLVSQAI
ncbi:MAG TPA: DUF2442 domain-containing protein [Gallionellaceae bacterium]|nr:DUF2442 domain-containing protein [Gallionellaceae bacterium]